jgi:hypothetical protein
MEEGQEKMGHLKSNGRVAEPPLPPPKKHITTGVDREEQCHKTPCTVAVVLAGLLWPLMNRNPLNTLSVPQGINKSSVQQVSSRKNPPTAHTAVNYSSKSIKL